MTTVAVLVDPPREGLVLPRLPETSPLSAAEAADLYAAMTRDVVVAVAESGGDLLVNYRPDDALPAGHRGEESAEAAVRAVVRGVLADPDAARFEVQVGETFAGRAGNTVTHLLEREDVDSAAVVEPSGPFLGRTDIDGAAMKLRRNEVVLGPAPGGRVHYAAFAGTIDFQGAYDAPAVGTLAERAREAGHDVDFVSMLPVIETGRDLAGALSLARARETAGLAVPEHFTAACADLGLAVAADDGDLRIVR